MEKTSEATDQKVVIEMIEAIGESDARRSRRWRSRQSRRSKRSPAVDWETEAFEAIKTIDASEVIDTNGAIEAHEAT